MIPVVIKSARVEGCKGGRLGGRWSVREADWTAGSREKRVMVKRRIKE